MSERHVRAYIYMCVCDRLFVGTCACACACIYISV